ncbi:MAG: flippase-like domain-containing protein [Dehalococcoidia bacterium]|nr:flippase-like domain-containing protein [Dehalococcoidia bacterium]
MPRRRQSYPIGRDKLHNNGIITYSNQSRRLAIGSRPPETSGFSLRRRFLSAPTLVSFGVAVAVLAFLATRFSVDMGATWQTVRHTNPWLYGLAFLVHYTTFLFRGARWRMLLRNTDATGSESLPSLVVSSRLILMGWFASSITWFRLGDAYRAYAYCKVSGASVARSMGTVVAERVMDVLLVFLLLLAGFLLLYLDPEMRPPGVFLAVGLGLALASGLFLLAMQLFHRSVTRLLPQRIQRSYRGFYEGTMRSFRSLPPVMLMGLLGWLAEVGRLYFVVRATGLEVGVALVVFVTLANALLSAVPLSPGGLGIVEAGIVGLLMWVLPREEAVSVALLDRSISYLSVVLLGGAAFVYHQRVVARRSKGVILSGQQPTRPGEAAP